MKIFESIVRFALARYRAILLLTAIFMIVAASAFRELPIEAYPDLTDPMVEIVTVFPGQSAERVERIITLEIERVVAGTPELTNLRSVSVFGLSLVTLRFEDGSVERINRNYVAERLREAELPDGVEALLGPEASPVGQILRYTVHGPRSLKDLRAFQDWTIERRLRSVPGVADVVTFGGFERQYTVRIDPVRLASVGITVAEVFEALERTNSSAGGGYVGIGSQEFIVRGLGTIRDPRELGHTLIRAEGGVPIRINDVADIVESSTPRRGSVGRNLDDEVVEGIVLLRRGENPSRVLKALHQEIDELHDGVLPPDVRLEIFYDRQALVDQTLSTVGRNLLLGALLVVLTVFIFLRSIQAALLVGTLIPLTLLAAFLGLRSLGMSANLISLGAIDFGILVEPAAVLLESTLHVWAMMSVAQGGVLGAEARREGIVRAVRSASRPILFSTMIILLGLIPLFLLERVEGRIFAPMAYTYVFALIAAPIFTFTLIPALIHLTMRGKIDAGDGFVLRSIKPLYERALRFIQKKRALTLGAAAGIFLLIASYAGGIGTEFLPELNEGGLYITAVFPSTIALDETRRHTPAIRDRILALPETEEVLVHIGRPEDATQIEGPNNAEFFVKLRPEREWRHGMTRFSLEEELRESFAEIPGVQFNFSQPITDRVFETISGIIGQVVVKIRGEDLDEMTRIAEAALEALRPVEGIADLSLYQAGEIPQMRINLDRERLAARGLHVADVQRTIEIALGGAIATEVWQGEQRYGVSLKLPEYMRRDKESIGRLVVGSEENRVMLAEVADIDTSGRGRAAIWREDHDRFIALKFNVRGRDLGSTVADAKEAFSDAVPELPGGIRITWGGEFENQQRAMERLAYIVPSTILLMIFSLYLNFRRWRPTLIIASLLPIAAIAAVAALRLSGETFSVSSAIGCITLLGQLVLLGVLMCTRIDEAAARGEAEPIVRGALAALRPILLMFALASFGLLPLAASYAMGSESQRPFARALIGGLLMSLPLVLFILPLLYRPIKDAAARAKGAGTLGTSTLLVFALGAALSPSGAMADQAAARDGVAEKVSAQPVNERDLIARWLASSPEAKAIQSELGAARFDLVTARLFENPEVGLEGAFLLSGEPPDGRRNFGAALSWRLPRPGERSARMDAAERGLDVAEMQAAYRLWLGAAQIREAAVAAAFARARLDLIDSILEELRAVERIVSARGKAGVDPAFDALRVELSLETLIAERGDAFTDLSEAETFLLAMIADPSLHSIELDPGSLAGFDGEAALEALRLYAFERRPDRLLAERGIAAKEAAVTHLKRSARPAPELSVGMYITRDLNSTNLSAGLRLPLPVSDRQQGEIGRARAEAEARRYELHVVEARIEAELRGAYERRRRAESSLERYRERGSQLAERLLERAKRAYMGGGFTIVELLDAYEAVWEARRQELELRRELAHAEAELRRVVAADLSSD